MGTATFVREASEHERRVGTVLLALAVAYLAWFVPRGWIPHDEGMLGQTAEWVLKGGLPHVHYQEPYTGGLTWLYAATFRLFGIDLINVRWLLFAAASFALIVVYAIVRRFLAPIGSALATWVALAWSFPNYFAGLPSWWVLICALGCIWALFRYVETALLRYVALAGLLAGCAIVIKQTGVYLLLAVAMSLLAGAKEPAQSSKVAGNLDRLLRLGVSVCTLAFATAIMSSRLGASEIAYLLVPIAASSLALASARVVGFGSSLRSRVLALSLACAMAALPLIFLLLPYFVQDNFAEFVKGAIILPQRRLAFASAPLPPVSQMVAGILMMTWMLPVPPTLTAREARVLNVVRWALAAGLAVAAFWSVLAYQFVFGSVRAVAALLPTLIVCLLLSSRVKDENQRRFLFISSSMLAWASLVQFPFGIGLYFCYVMPLAVIAAVAAADANAWLRRPGVLAWTALLLVFAVFSMNRGYAGTVGAFYVARQNDVPLNLERAHLSVTQDQVATYRRLVSLIDARLQQGRLLAGPDCPEVYFLTGRFNPSGAIFDFFLSAPGRSYVDDASGWTDAKVIVINRQPKFSPAVADSVLSQLRVAFPRGERVERFEVRWR
jgi:hypothetical protein